MIYAFRSRTGRAFRRSGVSFPHDKWTIIYGPTLDQLSESQLINLEIDGPEDSKLAGFVVGEIITMPDEDSATPEDLTEPTIEAMQAVNSGLRDTIAEKDRIIAKLEQKIVDAVEVPETVTINMNRESEAQVVARPHVTVQLNYVETLDTTPIDGFEIRELDVLSGIPSDWIDEKTDAPTQTEEATADPFAGLKGLGDELKAALINAGITDLAAVKAADDKTLLAINGIGEKKLADIREQLASL